jgi:hypothetical protein
MRTKLFTALPFFGSIVGASLLAGCPDRTISSVPPQQQGVTSKNISLSADIDILFVIDNSKSTGDKQQIFDNNFPNFINALNNFPASSGSGTALPNLHIGVVDTTVDIGQSGYAGCPSPDSGDNGLLQNTARVAGCTPPSGLYISDIALPGGTRMTNYGGAGSATDLGLELQCIGEVGTSGCGFEAQLEAMHRALDGTRPENAGFIRPSAYLAVIFLTDEDDASTMNSSVFQGMLTSDFPVQPLYAYKCDTAISASNPGTYTNCTVNTTSMYLQDPSFYSSFLSGFKDPSQLVVAVIAGPPPGLATNDSPPQGCTNTCAPTGGGTGTSPCCGAMNNTIYTGGLNIPGGGTQMLALENSCSATINGNAAIARPGVRLASFLSNFGADRGRFYTVCQSDYSAALADIGATLFNAVSPCLEGPIDTTNASNNTVGYTQLQCTVTDVQSPGTSAEMQTLVPPCTMDGSGSNQVDPGNKFPCWYDQNNTTLCPTSGTSGWSITVDRNGATAPTGTTTQVQCAIISM